MNNIIDSLTDYNQAVQTGTDLEYKDLMRKIRLGV